MELDGVLADLQLPGNLAVGQTARHQLQHLQLARREGFGGRLDRRLDPLLPREERRHAPAAAVPPPPPVLMPGRPSSIATSPPRANGFGEMISPRSSGIVMVVPKNMTAPRP